MKTLYIYNSTMPAIVPFRRLELSFNPQIYYAGRWRNVKVLNDHSIGFFRYTERGEILYIKVILDHVFWEGVPT
jgi:hypothetical protein